MAVNTYKAMQVIRPGDMQLVELEVPTPGIGEALIRVEACGICGADAGAIEGLEAGLKLPRTPGHEVVGRIVALGAGTTARWQIGQRVGVGRLGGHCNACEQCRRGHFNLCLDQPVVGSSQDGGYAQMMIARVTGLVAIPDVLGSVDAAPLLCAGIATFNALRKSGALAGDLVAVHGIGGLGHLALQYARRMGLRVAAIGRGADIEALVLELGAHCYIDSQAQDPVARLKSLGGAQVILTTITDSAAVSPLIGALAPQGTLLVVGVGHKPLSIMPGALVGGERTVRGTIIGTPYESEKTLDFSVMADVRARIETMPLERAQEAYQRVRSGQVQFRMVLTMSDA